MEGLQIQSYIFRETRPFFFIVRTLLLQNLRIFFSEKVAKLKTLSQVPIDWIKISILTIRNVPQFRSKHQLNTN